MILNTKVLIKLFIAVTKRKYRDRQTETDRHTCTYREINR